MKLLKLKLNSPFRGLPKGFELDFRKYLTEINKQDEAIKDKIKDEEKEQETAEPICLVGLNGSGKSNTLEVICEIFYYLELITNGDEKIVETIQPRYAKLEFEIEYIISPNKWKLSNSKNIVRFAQINDELPVVIRCKKEKEDVKISSFNLGKDNMMHNLKYERWNDVLPTKIIGYSSGQNELISNAFIKLDFHYFDEFQKRSNPNKFYGDLDVNRMFFMDYASNELVVLANYLFQFNNLQSFKDEQEFNKKLKIESLHSFSIKLQFKDYKNDYIQFPSELNVGIEKLKKCATTWIDTENDLDTKNLKNRKIELDYYVSGATRKAFRNQFKTPFELFKLLYWLRLLNIHCISVKTRNTIKQAPQGTNLSDLLPKPAAEDLVFNIDGICFKKLHSDKPVYYKQLSDGEHQLLHVIGTLRLMNEPDTLFILDEPETHFNPEWRAKMISLIMGNNLKVDNHQDYFITSHSPFIISDCKPNNVYIFNRTGNKIKVETAAQKRINTFGTSVNILTEEIFNKNESIGDYSIEKLNEIKNRKFSELKEIQQAKEDARILGESVEKTLLFRKLIMLEEEFTKKDKKKK